MNCSYQHVAQLHQGISQGDTFGCCLTVNAGQICRYIYMDPLFFGLQGGDRYIYNPANKQPKEIPTDTWNIPQTQKTTGL